MDRELYMTALRVLSKFARGEKPDKSELTELRRHAFAEEADLSIDELCCRIIHRYLSEPERWYEKLVLVHG